jgi:DNA invertase Pin-like site-specific DNA recombinase
MFNLINKTMKYGYARVSTEDQSLNAQIDQLHGCNRIFKEKIGAMKDRPELEKLLNTVKDGDIVMIVKLDRLGRSLKHLISIVELLHSKGVDLISINDGINTTTSQGRLMFNILGSFAEFERELISERTKSGLKAVRARGQILGRPFGQSERVSNKMIICKELQGKYSIVEICKMLSISRDTYYRYMK